MKSILLSFIIVLAYMNTQAQNVSPDDQVFTIVQQQPKFPGNVNDWLAQNIVYPEYAKNNNIHGTVFVGFVVEKDGSVSNVTIKQGVQSSLDQEALRVISLMPRWSPGMQNGQAVRVQYMVPIRFMLNDQPATNNQPIKDNNEVYNTVQQMPKFPGEVDAWLASNIVYPSDAKSRGVYGTVYISFIIEKNGAISNPIIYKGVEGGESLNKEALRVVSMMPNWTPGNQNGMAVRVKEMLPVAFMPQSEHHYSNNNGSGKQSVADPYGNTIQVDQKPEYHGNLLSFLAANLRYPEAARQNKIEGSVPVSFVVGTDGTVSDAKIEKSANGRQDMEDEALRVISMMPRWKPAMQNGQPVAVRLYLSVPFFINVDEE